MMGPDDMHNTNYAYGSSIGIQAQVVHDSTVYLPPPGATPQEKFAIAVRYLDNGMPARALKIIDEVIADGYATSEVGFHWLLALFSNRTIHQLTSEDVAKLKAARGWLDMQRDDEWAEGWHAIERLLREPDNSDLGLKVFERLGSRQREQILQHLDLLLKGRVRDVLWEKAYQDAKSNQWAGGRADRVWMFFEPKPAGPRQRPEASLEVSPVDLAVAVGATLLATIAVGYLVTLALDGLWIGVPGALLLMGLGGYAFARAAVDWRFTREQRSAKARLYSPRLPAAREETEPGFVRQVDHDFDYYFAKYRPPNSDPEDWKYRMSGFRAAERDDVVELYREQRTRHVAIRWLVRARTAAVVKRYREGSLHDYAGLRMGRRAVVELAAGLLGLASGAELLFGYALRAAPLPATFAMFASVVAAAFGADRWMAIAVDRRRVRADNEESKEQLRRDEAAYAKWQHKLSRKPSDREMAAWLESDRKILVQAGLEHYRLLPSQVIAHGFIEGRAKSSRKQARHTRGAWRYDRYSVRIFLLTDDGVRQMAAEIDFLSGTFHNRQRTNYRFDAIASVRVAEVDDRHQTFELMLVNGDPITEDVIASHEDDTAPDAAEAAQLTLDAAGLNNTLHVLEGIAAEGKGWAAQEKNRGAHREAALFELFDS